jgi:hypothetical protein
MAEEDAAHHPSIRINGISRSMALTVQGEFDHLELQAALSDSKLLLNKNVDISETILIKIWRVNPVALIDSDFHGEDEDDEFDSSEEGDKVYDDLHYQQPQFSAFQSTHKPSKR